MRLKIIHETQYTFNSEIFIEPHYLRFKPKPNSYIEPESFKIMISPEPAGITEQADIENNLVHFTWYNGVTQKLNIHCESVLRINDYNPLNFIFHPPEFKILPFSYNRDSQPYLEPLMEFDGLNEALIDYGDAIKSTSKNDTLNFLSTLTRRIHGDFKLESRIKGEPFNPGKTFDQKKGSCRDLSWMQIHLLRYYGIASRFVSGYYYISADDAQFELHAWLEVFLPGAGWIGLDPGHGIFTSNHHIPVATGGHYRNTMPVSGTIRGQGTSELKTHLLMFKI